MLLWLWILFFFTPLYAQNLPEYVSTDKEYYKNHFILIKKHYLKDTLFEKTIWRRKVSHLVVESKNLSFPTVYRVTLLMIQSYPDNLYSHNYPLYYEFNTIEEAQTKLYWLDKFLDNNGVARIKIDGNKIIQESIVYKGDSEK